MLNIVVFPENYDFETSSTKQHYNVNLFQIASVNFLLDIPNIYSQAECTATGMY